MSKTEDELMSERMKEIGKKYTIKPLAAKHDAGKPQLSLVPQEAVELIAQAMSYGAIKYGRNNFKAGHQWSRCLDAALRHLYALAHGQPIDPESGNTHLSHALASLAMLAYHVKHHPELNDLYTTKESTNE